MNNVSLVGRLAKEIELRHSQSGTAVAKFTLAVNRPFKKDEVDFINCIAFGKTAEVLTQYVKKGHQLGITGSIQTGSYDAQDGTKRYTTDIIVNGFDFLANKSNDNNTKAENLEQYAPSSDEDMPF